MSLKKVQLVERKIFAYLRVFLFNIWMLVSRAWLTQRGTTKYLENSVGLFWIILLLSHFPALYRSPCVIYEVCAKKIFLSVPFAVFALIKVEQALQRYIFHLKLLVLPKSKVSCVLVKSLSLNLQRLRKVKRLWFPQKISSSVF